jgi:hypothetical protein
MVFPAEIIPASSLLYSSFLIHPCFFDLRQRFLRGLQTWRTQACENLDGAAG